MRSLRGRLTLSVLLVLAAVLLVAGVVASREVDASERAAFDDRLRRTAELSRATATAVVQEGLPEDDRQLDAVLRATATSLRLTLGREVLFEAGTRPPAGLPALRVGMQTVVTGGRRFRAYVSVLRDEDLGGLARLQVVSSLEGLERRRARLDRRLAPLGALALVIAGAASWLAASLVLRPLRRLRAVTSSVAADEDLGRRVPADDGPAELRSLAASFNAMLARLGRSRADRERALAATRRFAADAGHELRTPLTSVQATLSALRRHPELDDARRSAMLDDALGEQHRLVALLDGLQALARGDAGEVDVGTVDLAELADAAVGGHPGRDVAADLPQEPVPVRGWEPGLRMLIGNLVDNAVVHGRPGGRVRVSVLPASVEAGPVLHVDDDGPGVAPADRQRILQPFARVDGTDRPGSGLGLAIVAQQAEHHGAALEVGEGPLGGARFSVRFPRPGA